VHEDRSVKLALISVLAMEFVDRRRSSVPFDTINETVARNAKVPPTIAMPVISTLVQRLTVTQALVFKSEENCLVLTQDAVAEPSTVRDALRSFWDNRDSEKQPTESATKSEQPGALTDFFEGFEKEIMKARLGDEGSRDHG
jgi:hypothetical protein